MKALLTIQFELKEVDTLDTRMRAAMILKVIGPEHIARHCEKIDIKLQQIFDDKPPIPIKL